MRMGPRVRRGDPLTGSVRGGDGAVEALRDLGRDEGAGGGHGLHPPGIEFVARSRCSPERTRSPASARIRPPPEASGFGSGEEKTIDGIDAAMIASVHGPVRPR